MVPKLSFGQRVTWNCRREDVAHAPQVTPETCLPGRGPPGPTKGTYYSIFVVVIGRSQPTGLRVDRNLGGLAALRADRFEISSFANDLHV